jgi:hypothetical protein
MSKLKIMIATGIPILPEKKSSFRLLAVRQYDTIPLKQYGTIPQIGDNSSLKIAKVFPRDTEMYSGRRIRLTDPFSSKLSNCQKFNLCLSLIINTIVNRQFSRNIMECLNRKISLIDHNRNYSLIHSRRTSVSNALDNLVFRKRAEIEIGRLNLETVNTVTDLLLTIFLKPPSINQRAKLRDKIIKQFAVNELYVSQPDADTHLLLKYKIMELSPQERARILSLI